MRYIVGFLILLFVVLLQASLLPLMAVGGVSPNLLLVYLLSIGFTRKMRGSLLAAVVGGSLLDLSLHLLFGLSSLLFVLIIVFSNFFSRRLRFKYLQISLFTLMSSFIVRLVMSFPETSYRLSLSGAFLDALIIMGIYPLVNWAVENLLPKEALQLSFRDKL